MFKYIVIALAVLGGAYAMMMYAGGLFKQVAFTTQPTGPISVAACILTGAAVLMCVKLNWK